MNLLKTAMKNLNVKKLSETASAAAGPLSESEKMADIDYIE